MNELSNLMDCYARADTDEVRLQTEDEVWTEFGVEGAVCIHDMAGFTRLTESHGIVRYLSMVRSMHLVSEPIIERYHGKVVKFEADNCFARFPDVQAAVQSSIAINIALDAINQMTPDDLDIHISTGIDYGRFLLIEDSGHL